MDGFETAELIRSRPRSRQVPILFLTGYRNEEHLFRGYDLGAVDFLFKRSDAETVLAILAEAGLRTEIPAEGWLVKVYEEDRLVDLIFSPVQRPVTDETLADTDVLPVNACHMPVLSATELMIHKILSYGPHSCDYSRALPVARALREQIDWARVERQVARSPYAQTFLILLDKLGVVSLAEASPPGVRRAKLKEVAG